MCTDPWQAVGRLRGSVHPVVDHDDDHHHHHVSARAAADHHDPAPADVVVGRFTTPYDCFAESWRWTYQPENEIVEIGQPN